MAQGSGKSRSELAKNEPRSRSELWKFFKAHGGLERYPGTKFIGTKTEFLQAFYEEHAVGELPEQTAAKVKAGALDRVSDRASKVFEKITSGEGDEWERVVRKARGLTGDVGRELAEARTCDGRCAVVAERNLVWDKGQIWKMRGSREEIVYCPWCGRPLRITRV